MLDMFSMISTIIWLLRAAGLAGGVLFLAWLAYSRWAQFGVWSRQQLAGPPPNLLTGNALEFLGARTMSDIQAEWFKRYTPTRSIHCETVGFFIGGQPCLITTDLELIRRVCVKDFHLFADRQRVIAGFNPLADPTASDSMAFCDPNRYHSIRRSVNKAFTPQTLKDTIPLIRDATELLLTKLDTVASAESGSELSGGIDVKSTITKFTADMILRCAFGLDNNGSQNENTEASGRWTPPSVAANVIPVLKSVQTLSTGNPMADPFLAGALLFPGLSPAMKYATLITYRAMAHLTGKWYYWQPYTCITRYLYRKVKERDSETKNQNNDAAKPGSSVRHDLLHFMMLSREDVMTRWEVAATSVIFFAGGNETTSTTMAFLSHYLINDEALQERVYEEIKTLLERDGELNYNVVTGLPLLDACIKETLRLHPPLSQVLTRDTLVDYTYTPPEREGRSSRTITIPKGCSVVVGMQLIHRDPVYWGDSADDFLPERFLPDRNGVKPNIEPLAYLPWGLGPRNCVGQRFAVFGLKLSMAIILERFKLLPDARTYRGRIAPVIERNFSQQPEHGVYARIERRTASGTAELQK